jgi:small conductance mechanosensitive channel
MYGAGRSAIPRAVPRDRSEPQGTEPLDPPPPDATRESDIRYYRESAIARRLTAQAGAQARRAQREALVMLPVVVGIFLLWHFREDLFGSDTPVRVATAILLAVVGWRFARDLGRALGPRLLARTDPGTAAAIGFLVQLTALAVVVIVALRLVDLDPRAIALGGAVTAVILGLAAQSTIGNLIAGIVLIAARPFRVGERVRMQGGTLGGEIEGTVVNQGLVYTTLARGEERILVPNNGALSASIVPLRRPAGVDLRARLQSGVKTSDLQRLLQERVKTPTRDDPHISLDEIDGDSVLVRITATPVSDADGGRLADEVLAALADVTAGDPQLDGGRPEAAGKD